MRRYTDNDKHIGKRITYGKTTCKEKNFRCEYVATIDEDSHEPAFNAIYLQAFGHCLRIVLPAIIKPLKTTTEYLDTWSGPTPIKKTRPSFFDRRYGFSLYDNFFQVFYGVYNDGDMDFPKNQKEHRKSWFLPWLDYRLSKHRIYDGNDVLVWKDHTVEAIEAGDPDSTRDNRYEKKNAMYRQTYLIADYDGKELKLKVHSELMEWKRGQGWFKWLSLFMDGIKKTTVDFEFEEGAGRRKNDWKGGLIGIGYAMLPEETIEEAVTRIFREKLPKDPDLKGIKLIKRLS